MKKWTLYWDPAGNVSYQHVASALRVLNSACARDPGIVLADLDAGHWITYHTGCSVIADVFLLTAQHERKAREALLLLEKSPEQLLAEPEKIRYVFAFHAVELLRGAPEPDLEELRQRMRPLESALLGDVSRVPSQYRLLWQGATVKGQVYARLFEIQR